MLSDSPFPLYKILLQILNRDGLKKQADALVKATAMPAETHPEALAAWLVAQTLYHESAERYEEAQRCIESAYDISPDSPSVKILWKEYKNGAF